MRRNPAVSLARGFSPGATLKTLTSTALPVVGGFVGVNLVMLGARALIGRFAAEQWNRLSPGTRAASEAAIAIFVGIPAVAYVGGRVAPGKRSLAVSGAIANAGLSTIEAVASFVPGAPAWVGSLLSGWPGGSGVFGVQDYLTAAQQPPAGVGDYMTVGGRGQGGALPMIAGGGRGAF